MTLSRYVWALAVLLSSHLPLAAAFVGCVFAVTPQAVLRIALLAMRVSHLQITGALGGRRKAAYLKPPRYRVTTIRLRKRQAQYAIRIG
jgi:hypothetical protein